MAKSKRKFIIGKMTLCGEEYPACVNVRVLQRLEDEGIEFGSVLAEGTRRWKNLTRLIFLTIEEGAALSGVDEPPTEDEIGAMIDISELKSISEQLADLLGGKGRKVEADPPKN